jgi:hypothetical protein
LTAIRAARDIDAGTLIAATANTSPAVSLATARRLTAQQVILGPGQASTTTFGAPNALAASPVMDAGDGAYLISARACGAQPVAYTDAQKFCAQSGDDLHPIVITTQERDIYKAP